jgi:hypothetical protein
MPKVEDPVLLTLKVVVERQYVAQERDKLLETAGAGYTLMMLGCPVRDLTDEELALVEHDLPQ